MNISKLALIALLGGALMVLGCGDSGSGGTGGTAGSGGSGGSAGSGGSGGTAGSGGEGGSGGVPPGPTCEPQETKCANGDIEATEETCVVALPPDEDGCDGTESLVNPATCTPADNLITVVLTEIVIDGDCNSGNNIDSCDGVSCQLGGLAPGEGVDGVDNALAGLAPVLANVGGNLGGVNQAFHDGICAGDIVIGMTIDANLDEDCANVDLLNEDGSVARSIVMNFSDTACLSGTVGIIPLNVAGIPGQMNNAQLRGTVSNGGLSNGSLTATVDDVTAGSIADQLITGGSAVVAQVLDINDDLSGNTAAGCNALSMTLNVSGIAAETN